MKLRSRLILTAIALLGATITGQPHAIAQSTSTPITVHFPRMPISGFNFGYTYNVPRTTTNPKPEIGALQEIFNGPTAAEISIAPGLQAPIGSSVPATACNAQPLPPSTINAGRFMVKRLFSGNSIAYKIRFCQPFSSGGIGDDARLQSAITTTLWANLNTVGFGVNNISSVKIATSNNSCLGGSGATCWP
jgi:hypothetical protein